MATAVWVNSTPRGSSSAGRPMRPMMKARAPLAAANFSTLLAKRLISSAANCGSLSAALPADERTPVRERLLELFGLIGDHDPRVIRARGRLASLLF